MKLPFSIDKFYESSLSKSDIINLLESIEKDKKYGGLRIDRFKTKVTDFNFVIERKTSGLDGFTLEKYPLIEGEFIKEKPTIVYIRIKPNYSVIAFFSLFVLTFILAAIFLQKLTINGIERIPTISERLLFGGLGGLIPGLWCFFGYMKPVKKAEAWIVERLNLSIVNNIGG